MTDLKRSWIESANSPDTDFPLNNLPYGVFSVGDGDLRCGVAIGDRILDATGLEDAGVLRADPDADVVYIATPHTMHCENTLLCLDGGKHVLCEKPFAVNESQVRMMIAKAQEKGLFLMEAMWMRFIPLIRELRKRLSDGVIGEVRMIQADFGFRVDFAPERRLFSPALAGGALLDVGIYPIEFSGMILGAPTEIVSMPTLGETGVDEQSAYILKHAAGQLSVLSSAVRTHTSQSAWIYGEFLLVEAL